jgi:hypothetical protein
MGWGGMKVRWERWKRGLVGKLSFSVLMAGGISHICISFSLDHVPVESESAATPTKRA